MAIIYVIDNCQNYPPGSHFCAWSEVVDSFFCITWNQSLTRTPFKDYRITGWKFWVTTHNDP